MKHHRKRHMKRLKGGSAFTDFFTKTIPQGVRSAVDWIKKKPLTAVSSATGALGVIPSPFAPVLRGISAATGVGAKLTGKGRRRKQQLGRGVVRF